MEVFIPALEIRASADVNPGPISASIWRPHDIVKPSRRDLSHLVDEAVHSPTTSTNGSSRASSSYDEPSEDESAPTTRASSTSRRASDAERAIWLNGEENTAAQVESSHSVPSPLQLSYCRSQSAGPTNSILPRDRIDSLTPSVNVTQSYMPQIGDQLASDRILQVKNDTTALGNQFPDLEFSGNNGDIAEYSDGEYEESDEQSRDFQPADFQNAVVQAVFPDRELAAYLIIRLYGMIHRGFSKKVSRTVDQVDQWREQIIPGFSCATDSGTVSSGKPYSSATTAKNESPKHDRSSGSTESDFEGDEDEEEDDIPRRKKRSKDEGSFNSLMTMVAQYACPFFIKDPAKYCLQSDGRENALEYRICAGPGWKSIQTLKEHLKRKHYPVQCDRCYEVFPYKGNDRPMAVERLALHRRSDSRCPKNPESMKEGISDTQWSSLEQKKPKRRGKSTAEETPKTDVEKWNDIWHVLFPDTAVPPSPFYPTDATDKPFHPPQGLQGFMHVYNLVQDHMLPQILNVESVAELREKLAYLGSQSFNTWSKTFRWKNDSSLSSSNLGSGNPMSATSWEYIDVPSDHIPSTMHASPFARLNRTFPQLHLNTPHPGTINNLGPPFPQDSTLYSNATAIPMAGQNLTTSSNAYGLNAMSWPNGQNHSTFQQTNLVDNAMGGPSWDMMGYNSAEANFGNGSMATNLNNPAGFVMEGLSPVPELNRPWNQFQQDQFSARSRQDPGLPDGRYRQS